MSETQGLIAGLLLLFALVVYTFWPENAFARKKSRGSIFCLSARSSCMRTCAT
jgi:hypothetical protein